MELASTFTVNLPVEDTWKVLTDLERVAPCLPGAVLLGVDGEVYRGAVKIKIGPITAQYQGTAQFVEKDDQAFRAAIRAEGKDIGGQGIAAATVTATLSEQGRGTNVELRTDLSLSGRVAQFGRGVIADVTSKLISQFVERLEAEVAAEDDGTPVASKMPPKVDDIEPLDFMSSLGGTVAKRAAPVLAVLLTVVVGIFLASRRTRVLRRTTEMAPSIVINLALPAAFTDPAPRS